MRRSSSSPASTIDYLLGDLFETDGTGTITASYTDGPAGDLAGYQGPPASSSTVSFLYYDAHGNLVAEADQTGALTASHTYDPFGLPTDGVPMNATLHRFVGRWNKQYDTSTGLVLMGARPYDPATGRFLSVDPIPGGSLNNYDYAGQDPINNYDLTGTCWTGLCWIAHAYDATKSYLQSHRWARCVVFAASVFVGGGDLALASREAVLLFKEGKSVGEVVRALSLAIGKRISTSAGQRLETAASIGVVMSQLTGGCA